MSAETSHIVGDKVEQTVQTAAEAARRPFVKKFARFGFYTKAFLFIVIGILAVMVAVDQKGVELADPNGALAKIATLRFGTIVLVIFIIGAISHGLWNILRGVADIDCAGGSWRGIILRSVAVGVGIFYLILSFSAFRLLIAEKIVSRSGEMQKTLASIVLALPLGSVLMVLIGIGTIIAGINEGYSGISGKYRENFRLFSLEKHQLKAIGVLGFFSFTARALIFCLIGYFFISAAINYNPNEAIGIDGALATLARTYYGKTILFVTAAGLVCHGLLSLYEARLRRIC